MNKHRKKVAVSIIIILAFVGYIVYAGFVSQMKEKQRLTEQDREIVGPNFSPPKSERPDGFLEYRNYLFDFSLFYPEELSVKEYDDGTSASTITFEDEKGEKSFQIYIIPYGEQQISEKQFKKDIPSGVMIEPIDVVIDGVRGTLFSSKDQVLGDTRELWFVRNGFLFEVTTIRDLDNWLGNIMKTWKFLSVDNL